MRNPDRIEPLLELLEQRWKDSPDLRLGQLLHALAEEDDIFYYEDTELAAALAEDIDEENPLAEMDYHLGENPFSNE